MPKMTAKYTKALHTARYEAKLSPEIIRFFQSQEELYAGLQYEGYFWNSKTQVWEFHEPEAAHYPTHLVMVRVWAESSVVDNAADAIIDRISDKFALVERSTQYQCRPPKQAESRVYLKFMPRGSK